MSQEPKSCSMWTCLNHPGTRSIWNYFLEHAPNWQYRCLQVMICEECSMLKVHLQTTLTRVTSACCGDWQTWLLLRCKMHELTSGRNVLLRKVRFSIRLVKKLLANSILLMSSISYSRNR